MVHVDIVIMFVYYVLTQIFIGTIPSAIGSLTSMSNLQINSNSLNGIMIIRVVFCYTLLLMFRLTLDMLFYVIKMMNILCVGTIPYTIGCLISISVLGLGSNCLIGNLYFRSVLKSLNRPMCI